LFKEFHHQVRGRGHVTEGVVCQDRTRFASVGGVQVMCLADGAGSASQSAHGAQALVDAGVKLLADSFDEFAARDDGAQVKVEIIERLIERLETVASRRKCGIRDLASTFLGVAAARGRFIVVHVGDGVIGYVKHGELKVVSAPDNDEFANETTFVTSSGAVASMRLLRGSLEGVSGFILMSDGPANSLFDHRAKQLAPACLKMIKVVSEAPRRSLKYPSYKKQLRRLLETRIRNATKDDCSLGILGRPIEPPAR